MIHIHIGRCYCLLFLVVFDIEENSLDQPVLIFYDIKSANIGCQLLLFHHCECYHNQGSHYWFWHCRWMVDWDHRYWMVNLHHHSWAEDECCHVIAHLILECDCAAALQLWCILVLWYWLEQNASLSSSLKTFRLQVLIACLLTCWICPLPLR